MKKLLYFSENILRILGNAAQKEKYSYRVLPVKDKVNGQSPSLTVKILLDSQNFIS